MRSKAINEGLIRENRPQQYVPNIELIYDIAKAPLGEDYGPAYTVGRSRDRLQPGTR
jgi:putative spermidine/putrescine transport system substrate-binding protein